MRHHFSAEQWVPYSRERVFAFFADPANLPPLMPGWQHARIENSVAAPALLGTRIMISFRPVPLLPFRLSWEAHIVEFRWNEFFCDEQGKGPFKYFRHCHRISEQANGSLVKDDVDYELPLGLLGDLANQIAVHRQIRSLFAHRQRMLLKLFGSQHSRAG